MNRRFNEWVDHLSAGERLVIMLCYVGGAGLCPVVAAIFMAYPDPNRLMDYGRLATIVMALLLIAPLISRWRWLNRHPLS